MTAPFTVEIFEQCSTPFGSTIYPVGAEYDGPTGTAALEWALGYKGPVTTHGFYPIAFQAWGLQPGEPAMVGVVVARNPMPEETP